MWFDEWTCLALLGFVTIVIGVLAVFLWRKTHDIGFPLGIAFFYYFSLYGSWALVIDYLAGSSYEKYFYLFEKVIPLAIDSYYLKALLLYSTFLIVLELCLLKWVTGRKPSLPRRRYLVSSLTLALIAFFSVGCSFLIERGDIFAAFDEGVSAYSVTREFHPLFTLHQILNRTALLSSCLGVAIELSGGTAIYCVARTSLFARILLSLSFGLSFLFPFFWGIRTNFFLRWSEEFYFT